MSKILNCKEQLKPCPFCGGNAVVRYINDFRYHTILVGCSKCWCKIEKTLDCEQADIKDTIKKWNTRAEIASGKSLDEVLDKMRAEILVLDDADYDFEGYYKAVTDALQIIDKYKAESEGKE